MSGIKLPLTTFDDRKNYMKHEKTFCQKRKRKTNSLASSLTIKSVVSWPEKDSSSVLKHTKMRKRTESPEGLVLLMSVLALIMATALGASRAEVSAGLPATWADQKPERVASEPLSGQLNPTTDDIEQIINRINLSAANWSQTANRLAQVNRFEGSILPGHLISRRKRATNNKLDSTRIVAVSGQWIELQCPLSSELQLVSSSSQYGTSGAPATGGGHQLGGRSIVWRKDGVPLNQLNPRQRINSQNGTLSISSAQSKLDEATYECALISATTGSATSASGEHQPSAGDLFEASKVHRFELKLVVAPRLAPFEFAADAQVGMKVVLTCSALEGQQPISFVWLKDNQIIGGDHSPGGRAGGVGGGGGGGNSLNQVHQQQLADKLALANGFEEEQEQRQQQQQRAQLRKQAAEYVLVLEEPQHGNGNGNAPAIIASQQVNKAAPDNGEQLLPLLSDTNIRVRQSDDYSILSIEKLELKHSGRYTCSAQNEAARSSHSSMLAINAPPTFTIEPKDGNLVSGQSALLDCAASGQPRPLISWLRARESANNKLWDYVPVYDNLRYTTLPNGSLLISNVTQREQGYYLCAAKNGFGPEMTKLIKITVHEPAKFFTKYRTVEVRIEERANMVCQATGEQPISIEWLNKDGNIISKDDKKFIIDHDASDGGPGEPTANSTVSRLILARSGRPDSGHYACQASNKYGSDKMVTNLLVQDVPDKVTDLKVTNVTASTISIRWQVSFSGNSPINSYLVQYQSDDPLDDLLMSSSLAVGGSTSASNGLRQAGQLLAESEHNSPSQTNGDSRTGNSGGQLQRQSQLTDKGMTTTSSLKAVLDALNIESTLDSVVDEAIDRTLVELTIQQSSTHLVVKDLNPFCVYRLRLAGINKIGLGEFSEWMRAKTEEAAPSGAALKVNAAATGPNSIKLTWNPPDRRSWNGNLVGFNIAYRPIDSSFELNKTVEWAPPSLQSLILDNHEIQRNLKSIKQQNNKVVGNQTELLVAAKQRPSENPNKDATVNADPRYSIRQHLKQLLALQQQELVAHLTNLQRSTTYLVWIQSMNNYGLSPQSHAISVRTLDDVPPSAPAITIQSASPNSITITWSLMSNFVSSLNQYSLFYRRAQQQQVGNPAASILHQQSHLLPEMGTKTLDSSQLLELVPFIERSINGQQLMLINAANNVANSFDNSPENQFDNNLQKEALKSSIMVQSQQHYQQFVYTLDQLDCGSVYELYMITQNSVGKSEPSSLVTARTLGEPPLAPSSKSNLFAKIGIAETTLNLAAWSTGGCPITHLTLKYRQAPLPVAASMIGHSSSSSPPSSVNQSQASSHIASWPISISLPLSVLESINNNQPMKAHYLSQSVHHEHQPGASAAAQPTYTLRNLLPNTAYDLEIAAYNAAGHTTAQYEFVTSSANGSRSGFSRKEGVFRLDQRGFPLEDLTDTTRNAAIEQQQSTFANQSSTIGHLMQLLLMPFCFVVILSLAICYYRVHDSRKLSQRRSGSPDSSMMGGQVAARGANCQQSSPSSIGKSSMWRINNQFNSNINSSNNNNQQRNNSATIKRRHHTDQVDSPAAALHYCVRDPSQPTDLVMMKQPSSSFSQSVSMKDFNLIDSAAHNQSASTLNFKNRAIHRDANKVTAATLRNGRLPNLDNCDYSDFSGTIAAPLGQLNQQVCPVYGATCKAQHLLSGKLEQNGALHNSECNPDSVQQQYRVQHQCGFPVQDGFQQQETSWTHYEPSQYGLRRPTGGTNYAIPISANNNNNNVDKMNLVYGNNFDQQQQQQQQQQQLDTYGQIVRSGAEQSAYGESSIDVCIQQLMNQQQYQEQSQQQQYAMIVNTTKQDKQDPNRCLYETNQSFNCQSVQPEQINLTRLDNLPPTNQSLIESTITNQNSGSSSSSGIDLGTAHHDCASTTTGGTSNSNNSNDGYQLAHPKSGVLA